MLDCAFDMVLLLCQVILGPLDAGDTAGSIRTTVVKYVAV